MDSAIPGSALKAVLDDGALKEGSLQNTDLATPKAALKGLPPESVLEELPMRLQLKPFEPIERIPWALERSITVALGPEGWKRVEEALPRAELAADLAAGVVSGIAIYLRDLVAEQIKLIEDGITLILDFYSVVFDVGIWIEMLKVWTAPQGSGIEEFAEYLRAEHRGLYAAVTSYRNFISKLDKVLAPLLSGDASVAMEAIGDWMTSLPVTLGGMLRPRVEELVANKGSAKTQGRIIGRVLAEVVIETVLLAMGLYSLIRGAARLSRDVFAGIREVLTSSELSKAAASAEQAAAGITAAGKT